MSQQQQQQQNSSLSAYLRLCLADMAEKCMSQRHWRPTGPISYANVRRPQIPHTRYYMSTSAIPALSFNFCLSFNNLIIIRIDCPRSCLPFVQCNTLATVTAYSAHSLSTSLHQLPFLSFFINLCTLFVLPHVVLIFAQSFCTFLIRHLHAKLTERPTIDIEFQCLVF